MKKNALITGIILLCLQCIQVSAQNENKPVIINDEMVPSTVIVQMENTFKIKFVPGNYWYDRRSGAFGLKDGPCTGIGMAGIQIGGNLTPAASGGGTGVCINGRVLHPADVSALQTFTVVLPGRYWMDMYGNFGYENSAFILGNLYQLCKNSRQSSYNKNNVWSGESTSFGKDGSFMYYSSKKSDGTQYEYFHD